MKIKVIRMTEAPTPQQQAVLMLADAAIQLESGDEADYDGPNETRPDCSIPRLEWCNCSVSNGRHVYSGL